MMMLSIWSLAGQPEAPPDSSPAPNLSPSAVSTDFRVPLSTQALTLSTLGPGAMSGSDVPASTLIASWLASRTVVRWTLIPVELSKGFKTSWYAFSSLPPHADQTVTSVDDAVGAFPPPDEQAIRRKTPRPPAIARELSLAKTSVITANLPKFRPLPAAPKISSPAGGAQIRRAGRVAPVYRRVKTNVRLR